MPKQCKVMMLSSFSTMQPYWYNKARVLDVLIQKWQGEDPDSSHMAMLEDIANLCPFEGGKGVYMARGILSKYIMEEVIFNGLAKCDSLIPRTVKHKTAGFQIYPNPTNDHLFIMAPENSQSEYTITLHDVLGKVVQRQKFSGTESSFSMPVTSLKNGLYILTIKDGNKSVLIEKIVKN